MSDAARSYDLFGHDFRRDPHPTFAAVRRDDPIYQQPGLNGTTPIWFVARYADVDDHRRLRDLVSQAFAPKRVADLRPRVQEIADAPLDPAVGRGEMGLITGFSFPLPTTVILELLGVPIVDRDRFRA